MLNKFEKNAFTLMEVVVATLLFLVAITISIGIFLSSTNANAVANDIQKIDNEVRYLLEIISKEVRLGTINYSYYQEVYNDAFQNPTSILALKDSSNNLIYFALDGDGYSSNVVQMSSDNGNTWSNLSTDKLIVDDLDFYLLPESDPFSQEVSLIKQPMVIIYLHAHYLDSQNNLKYIKIQTSISSRQYKK